MNYLKQLNAFKDYMMFHEIPSIAVLLWHTLMMINNVCGWRRQFNVPNALIELYGGLSKQRISEARAILVKQGLIHYVPGEKGRAPVYEMVRLDGMWNQEDINKQENTTQDSRSEANRSVEKSTQSQEQTTSLSMGNPGALPIEDRPLEPSPAQLADHVPDRCAVESRNIPKQKYKQKQKRRRIDTSREPFRYYEQNFGTLKPANREVIDRWCEAKGAEIVLDAMGVAVMYGGRTLRYIEKILQEWMRAGLGSLEQVQEYKREKEWNKERKQYVPFGKNTQQENTIVLDKLREEMLA